MASSSQYSSTRPYTYFSCQWTSLLGKIQTEPLKDYYFFLNILCRRFNWMFRRVSNKEQCWLMKSGTPLETRTLISIGMLSALSLERYTQQRSTCWLTAPWVYFLNLYALRTFSQWRCKLLESIFMYLSFFPADFCDKRFFDECQK